MDKRISALINTTVSALLGATAGSAITYLVVKKRIEARTNEEIESVKNQYRLLYKAPEELRIADTVTVDIQTETSEFVDSMNRIRDEMPSLNRLRDFKEETEIVSTNAYSTSTPTDDVIVEEDVQVDEEPEFPVGNIWERSKRVGAIPPDYIIRDDDPFVITREQFEEGHPEQETESLTYYEGDDTLAGENDRTITDIQRVIGARHLEMFGMGSDDPMVVYIRNLNIGMDFEVTFHEGEYVVQVYGVEAPRERGPKKVLRMRDDD